MYTTPRKVKQESRLRRSLSLTNAKNSIPSSITQNNGQEDYSSGEYSRHLHNIEEAKDSSSSTYFQFNSGGEEDLNFNHQRSRYSYTNGDFCSSNSIPDLVPGEEQLHPPPYNCPPRGEIIFRGQQSSNSNSELIVLTPDPHQIQGVPDSPISLTSLQIHSSKFPVVKEVVISAPQSDQLDRAQQQNPINLNQQQQTQQTFVPLPVLSPEYIKKFQNKKLTKKKQIAWTDERRAFTLDSETAKDLQARLATTITRASSADLGKAIQDFNEEQTRLMSSMQGMRRYESGGGLDNPALDLNGHVQQGQHLNYNKMPGSNGYSNNYGGDSTSQSLSLSSSNTDSLDTVIYKGPSAGQPNPSIRDWQRSMEQQQNGYQHQHRDSFDGRPYNQQQLQQQQQPQQYPTASAPNAGYAIEYRHSQQHQVQQNLSVHSIPQNGNGNGVPGSHRVSGYGSNPSLTSLPTKSPSLAHKSYNPSAHQVTFANDPAGEAKKDGKAFPSKTYNHIKDMISSRFGTGNGGLPTSASISKQQQVGLNNSPSVVNHNGEQNCANSYIDLTMGVPASYQNGSVQGQGIISNSNNNSNSNRGQFNAPSYYPQAQAQAFKSPNMSERKNVNTSFRKAIQQSSLKSNLTEDSLQLRPIAESQQQQLLQQQQQNFPNEERAQRALDKLMEGTGPNNPSAVYNRVQQFSKLHPQSYNGLVKPGPGSSNSNSSSGLALPESSLSSPGSYQGQGQGQWGHQHLIQHQHHHQPPPPLPSSKKPEPDQGSLNTIGLPSPEMRENGDGSSGTMDAHTGNMLLVQESSSTPNSCSKVKSDQLKKITSELTNITLSVAAEHNLHNNHSSSSECEKGPQRVGSGQSHTTTDSGLGTVMLTKSPLNSNSDPGEVPGNGMINADSLSSGNDSEWVDLVEPEIQHILDIERGSKSVKQLLPNVSTPATASSIIKHFQSQQGGNPNGNNSNNNNPSSGQNAQSKGSAGLADISASPILHPKSSPKDAPQISKQFDLNAYNKAKLRSQSQEILSGPSTSQAALAAASSSKQILKSPRVPPKVQRSNSGSGGQGHGQNQNQGQRWPGRGQRGPGDKNPHQKQTGRGDRQKEFSQSLKGAKITRSAMSKLGQLLNSLQDETGDMTSTTGLDFESALDGHTEFTTDDDDLSTTIDTTDAHAIRRQLESLESMYTEVLKLLGDKKVSRGSHRYPPNTAELRATKRRPYGSMSSLPSSVSSRPFRDRNRKLDDRKKVKDLKSINRRFQRLESHVVTLARSVAHLSSEMRTQHLMVQEMDSIRNELSQLRNQVVKNSMANANAQSASAAQNFARVSSGGRHGAHPCTNIMDWTSFKNALPNLTNPKRVRKLTKFFGDEPPLIRIFLKKLGYEKYAPAFESERIGIMELPYLTEERLNKMGIPMGPRLRILQEAQICLKPGGGGTHGQSHDNQGHHHQNNHNTGNLSVYVV